ncbi:hypothetical protein VUR80DRAFT_6671 [Thermomyces stellatus]
MGGNAVDAIVAAVFCVGTTGMYHSEIGGSGFMLVRSSDRTYETMNFREKAPAAAHRDMYKGNFDSSLYGSLASYRSQRGEREAQEVRDGAIEQHRFVHCARVPDLNLADVVN